MIVFDNHLHLRRDGFFINAVKEFKKAGGTHFILCQYPNPSAVVQEKSYKSVYNETLKIADEIKSKVDIGVFVTVGPYPVDYIKLAEKFGRDKAMEIMKTGMDEAAFLCEEKKCVAIGEIGRPHFPVDKQVFDDANEILFYGMQKAKDANVPVVLHTESTTPDTCREFVEMGKKAGLSPGKIVKHFSPPLIKNEENFGLMPSVLATKKNISNAIAEGSRFLMETDYIDDPLRPGAVLGPKTVPKTTFYLLKKGVLDEEKIHTIHVVNPEKTYSIELEG